MKRLMCVAVALACSIPITAHAQEQRANPVTGVVKEILDRNTRWMVEAAQAMPAEKYGFRPTPGQWIFGEIVSHVVFANYLVCSIMTDIPAPADMPRVTETDPKDKLVPALQASFDFCARVFPNLNDAKMGDTVTFFDRNRVARARAAIEVVIDLTDHYAQMAMYLRLNGILPPSANQPFGGFGARPSGR
jgi:hypothetical protein